MNRILLNKKEKDEVTTFAPILVMSFELLSREYV